MMLSENVTEQKVINFFFSFFFFENKTEISRLEPQKKPFYAKNCNLFNSGYYGLKFLKMRIRGIQFETNHAFPEQIPYTNTPFPEPRTLLPFRYFNRIFFQKFQKKIFFIISNFFFWCRF